MTELQMFGMLNLLPAIMGQQTVRTTPGNTAAYQSFDEALRTAVKNDVRGADAKGDVTAATESKHDKEVISNSEQSDLLFWSMLAGSYQRQMFWRALMNPMIWQ